MVSVSIGSSSYTTKQDIISNLNKLLVDGTNEIQTVTIQSIPNKTCLKDVVTKDEFNRFTAYVSDYKQQEWHKNTYDDTDLPILNTGFEENSKLFLSQSPTLAYTFSDIFEQSAKQQSVQEEKRQI